VFNLFVVSVFWSVLVDSFGSAAAKRLFGFIAAGGSLGGFCSSLAVGQLAGRMGLPMLLLIPVVILEVALFCFRKFDAESDQLAQVTPEAAPAGDGHQDQPTGGSVWEGMTRAFSSPYLFGICLFLLLGKFCATTVYLKQIEIVNAQVATQERRTELFAHENSAVQIVTLVFQAGLTGYLLRFGGLSVTLTLLPAVMVAALIYLAGSPTLLAVFVIQIIQRSLAYGVAEPARAVLFTVVHREDKYKTKSFIDTVIFRGGDVAASSLEKALVNAAKVMIPVTIVWAVLSWALGVQQRRLAKQVEGPTPNTP
jgi:AAA family ATP:ADP antiporter